MRHTKEELAQNLAERLCWQVAHRDDTRPHPVAQPAIATGVCCTEAMRVRHCIDGRGMQGQDATAP